MKQNNHFLPATAHYVACSLSQSLITHALILKPPLLKLQMLNNSTDYGACYLLLIS